MTNSSGKINFTYEILLNASRDMIFIHSISATEPHGPFLEVNDAACSTLEYTREEMLSLAPEDIVAKDDLRPTAERTATLAIKKKLTHEKTLISKSGQAISVELNTRVFEIDDQTFALSIARDISKRKMEEKEKNNIIKELQKAMDEIRTLRGILPLCCFCKKIRDDKGYWEQVDVYIKKYSAADISHSICPECLKKHYPDK